jgi:O-antigen/teichoic acid export membrane protein
MLRLFAKNSAIYFISGILTKSVSFLLLPLYTRILTQNDYGSLEAVSIISTLAIVLFSLQINEGVSRYYNELKNQKIIRIYTSTVAFFCISCFSVFLITSLLFTSTFSKFYGLDHDTTIAASWSIFLNAIFYLSQSQLHWKLKPIQEAVSGLTYNFSAIGLSILFLVFYDLGVYGILLAQCIASVAGIAIGYYFTRADFSFNFSFRVLKKLLDFSLPLIPRALSVFLYLFTDRICVKQILGLTELGVFSVGNKIAAIIVIVNLGIAPALSPLIYKYYKSKDTTVKIGMLFRIFCFLSLAVTAGLSFFAEQLILLLTPGDYIGAVYCIPFLTLSFFFSSLLQFFPGLALSKRTKLLSGITVLTSIINLIGNILFIPDFGILGASVVTAICMWLNFYLLYRYSQKEYWIDVTTHSLFSILIVFVCLVSISIYMKLSIYWNSLFFALTLILGYLLIIRKSDVRFLMRGLKKKHVSLDIDN